MDKTTHTTQVWIITGSTSGIGYRAALELARCGAVVLVGRNPNKLNKVKAKINALPGGYALSVVCDFADIRSVRRAAAEIVSLKLPIAGLANNAGIMTIQGGRSTQGWDISFATNHLGSFAFTEALIPHLPDGANVVFTCSAVEDPERMPAVNAGYRGGRYISAEASARSEWEPGGSSKPGFDAYATSKQCELATVFAFSREIPRLRFNAVEPGVNIGTSLCRDMNPIFLFVIKLIAPLTSLVKVKYLSTPKRAGRVITKILTDMSDATGVYYDECGNPMLASKQVRDIEFCNRVVDETRKLLATVPQN
jgi:NAD(P)-dependent dehydrogenase (short-subunit alcohol dehydrogenase family)